jgi:hypothetical protein
MATTTNYGWTTPDDTALVKDGAAAIRTLGSSVDTTTKNLNPETTLGDIAYRSSTANVNTRLGLGTAGQVLQVNSGASAPQWATLPASSPASASAFLATEQTTSSGTYTDLSTVTSVTLTTGTKALVILSSRLRSYDGEADVYISYAVSGSTTIAASDATSMWRKGSNNMRFSIVDRVSTLTAGSNTFTMKFKTNGNLAAVDRQITVIDLGS